MITSGVQEGKKMKEADASIIVNHKMFPIHNVEKKARY